MQQVIVAPITAAAFLLGAWKTQNTGVLGTILWACYPEWEISSRDKSRRFWPAKKNTNSTKSQHRCTRIVTKLGFGSGDFVLSSFPCLKSSSPILNAVGVTKKSGLLGPQEAHGPTTPRPKRWLCVILTERVMRTREERGHRKLLCFVQYIEEKQFLILLFKQKVTTPLW